MYMEWLKTKLISTWDGLLMYMGLVRMSQYEHQRQKVSMLGQHLIQERNKHVCDTSEDDEDLFI